MGCGCCLSRSLPGSKPGRAAGEVESRGSGCAGQALSRSPRSPPLISVSGCQLVFDGPARGPPPGAGEGCTIRHTPSIPSPGALLSTTPIFAGKRHREKAKKTKTTKKQAAGQCEGSGLRRCVPGGASQEGTPTRLEGLAKAHPASPRHPSFQSSLVRFARCVLALLDRCAHVLLSARDAGLGVGPGLRGRVRSLSTGKLELLL